MDFPQYRKRFDQKSFYKIDNASTFEEVQLIGDKKFIHSINADKYFEKMRIQEMLLAENEMFLVSTEEEYNRIKSSQIS